MATRDVSSEDELVQLRGFPEPACADPIRYCMLASADEAFVRILGKIHALYRTGPRTGFRAAVLAPHLAHPP
jgi:hypothetical protein